jgi:hypothetical protein
LAAALIFESTANPTAVEPKVTKRNSKIKAQISDLMEEIADLKLQLASSNARNEILLELMDKYMKVHE